MSLVRIRIYGPRIKYGVTQCRARGRQLLRDFLDSDEVMIEYLNIALAEGDPKYFAQALGNVARAKGMTAVAEQTGLGRQSLYKTLSGDGNPSVDTLFKVLAALGVRMAITQ